MLFDKPVSELKEAFVRARFAEDNYFGQAGIERWLERQRKARHPDVEQWNHCCSFGERLMLFAQFPARPIELLREYAEPSARVPEKSGDDELDEEIEHRAKLRPLLEGLDPKSFEVYYPYVHSPIIIWKGECEAGPEAFYWESYPDAKGHPTTVVRYEAPSPMVMDAIFATWLRQTPKAAKARELLCNLVAQDIAQVRREAEHDFDEAIGVTEDGKKITRASMVIVIDLPGLPDRLRLYRDARVFQDNDCKILRLNKGGLTVEVDAKSPQDFEKKVLARVKSKEIYLDLSNWSQVYLRGSRDRKGAQTVFITPAKFCQKTLPPGYVEI